MEQVDSEAGAGRTFSDKMEDSSYRDKQKNSKSTVKILTEKPIDKTPKTEENIKTFSAKNAFPSAKGSVNGDTPANTGEMPLSALDGGIGDTKPINVVGGGITFDAEKQKRLEAALLEKYPDCHFYEIDTMGITICSLMTVKEIGDMYKAGKSVEEMLKYAETEVNKVGCYFFADDLKFFRHSGRVSGIAGTMGTLLGIRPIIYMNEEGRMVSVGKEKGRVKAMERLVKYVEELGENVKDHRVIIGNTDSRDIAEEIEKMLKQRYGSDLRTEICDVNPTAGSHCGPNTVGVCFHAKRRSL